MPFACTKLLGIFAVDGCPKPGDGARGSFATVGRGTVPGLFAGRADPAAAAPLPVGVAKSPFGEPAICGGRGGGAFPRDLCIPVPPFDCIVDSGGWAKDDACCCCSPGAAACGGDA